MEVKRYTVQLWLDGNLFKKYLPLYCIKLLLQIWIAFLICDSYLTLSVTVTPILISEIITGCKCIWASKEEKHMIRIRAVANVADQIYLLVAVFCMVRIFFAASTDQSTADC